MICNSCKIEKPLLVMPDGICVECLLSAHKRLSGIVFNVLPTLGYVQKYLGEQESSAAFDLEYVIDSLKSGVVNEGVSTDGQ